VLVELAATDRPGWRADGSTKVDEHLADDDASDVR
jgi:hypothetical protein